MVGKLAPSRSSPFLRPPTATAGTWQLVIVNDTYVSAPPRPMAEGERR
jgi:hypothetical protein